MWPTPRRWDCTGELVGACVWCVRVRLCRQEAQPFVILPLSVASSTIDRLLTDAGKVDAPEFWMPHAGPYEVACRCQGLWFCFRAGYLSLSLITHPRLSPQADPGSFSAHGYETLPLLQSLLGANNFSAAHYATAAAAFFTSTPGHVEPLPAAWAPAAVAALQRGESAARLGLDSPAASAVVKVSFECLERGWG